MEVFHKMVTFSVPETAGGRRPFRFSVEGPNALLAGSRYRRLDPQLCRDVAEGLARLGFGFFVGCARGVDESFRSVLADSPWREDTWVACAFRSRPKAMSASSCRASPMASSCGKPGRLAVFTCPGPGGRRR